MKRLLVLFASLLLTGCYSSPHSNYRAPSNDTFLVEVINNNYERAHVWAIWEFGGDHRLAVLEGNTRQAVRPRIRSAIPGQIQFQVRLRFGGTGTSAPVPVAPGDTVQVVIDPMGHIWAAPISR